MKENRQHEAHAIISKLIGSSTLSFTYRNSNLSRPAKTEPETEATNIKEAPVSAIESKILKNLDNLLEEDDDETSQSIFSISKRRTFE